MGGALMFGLALWLVVGTSRADIVVPTPCDEIGAACEAWGRGAGTCKHYDGQLTCLPNEPKRDRIQTRCITVEGEVGLPGADGSCVVTPKAPPTPVEEDPPAATPAEPPAPADVTPTTGCGCRSVPSVPAPMAGLLLLLIARTRRP